MASAAALSAAVLTLVAAAASASASALPGPRSFPQLPELLLAAGYNESWPAPADTPRPPCVLINNYCGKVVPGTGMRKECCGDLVCYRNKCRRRTCC